MPKLEKHHGLSHRERQVIEFAAQGMTDSEIADALGIRPATVATYWQRVRLKYGSHLRAELILIVYREIFEAQLSRLREEIESMSATRLDDQHCRMALDAAAEAVFIVDARGRIMHANRFAEQLFGYEPDGLSGLRHDQLLVPGDRPRHLESVQGFFSASEGPRVTAHDHVQAQRRDGAAIFIDATISTIESAPPLTAICIARAVDAPAR